MEPIYVALIVAISTTVSPLLTVWLTGRNRRRDRLEDYARQDAVAARLLTANTQVARTAKATSDKLDVIHALVNSNMTAAMQSELDARRVGLAQMLEIIDLKRAAGHDPTQQTLSAVEASKGWIADLEMKLNDRLKKS